MSLFNWLFVGHLMGDFMFQTAWMADKKAHRWPPLLTHSAVYTVIVALMALFAGGLSWPAIALIFVGHVVIDQRGLVSAWAQHVSHSDKSPWLKVMLDQTLHLMILAAATQL